MDNMRKDQALAIVAALIKAGPATSVLEGWLGFGNVPDPKEFLETRDEAEIQQWCELLTLLGNATDLLRANIDERDHQKEFAVAEGSRAG